MPFDITKTDQTNPSNLYLITEAHFLDERSLHQNIHNNPFYEFKIRQYLTERIEIVKANKKAQNHLEKAVTILLISAGFNSFVQNPVTLIIMLFAGLAYLYSIWLVIKSPDLEPNEFAILEKNLELIPGAFEENIKTFVSKRRLALKLFERDAVTGRRHKISSPLSKFIRKFI